jgi:hypothetical protein
MVDVPALRVIFVTVAQDHDAALLPVRVIAVAPKVSVRTPLPLEEKKPHITVWPFVSSVPAVSVIVADEPLVTLLVS